MSLQRNITRSLIRRHYPSFDFLSFPRTPITFLSKPLEDCTVTLVTTGGLHMKSDPPFDLKIPGGDSSFRIIPSDASHEDIRISHKWYNHKFIREDLNCVFPMDRMDEYRKAGRIGDLSEEHISFMGHIYEPGPLIASAGEVARGLRKLRVDAAFLTPTWVICNQSVGLISRVLEEGGISTACVTFRKEITILSRPPRIISFKSSAGKPLGNPGDKATQRNIIEAAFDLLEENITDMTVVDISSSRPGK